MEHMEQTLPKLIPWRPWLVVETCLMSLWLMNRPNSKVECWMLSMLEYDWAELAILLRPYQLLEYQKDMRRCRFDINLGQCSRRHIADASALAAQTLVIEYLRWPQCLKLLWQFGHARRDATVAQYQTSNGNIRDQGNFIKATFFGKIRENGEGKNFFSLLMILDLCWLSNNFMQIRKFWFKPGASHLTSHQRSMWDLFQWSPFFF